MSFLKWFGVALADDEPVDQQARDVSTLVQSVNWKQFDACDEFPGAKGSFGFDAANPIPVNGPVGETVYLNRLRSKSGVGVLYHRIGTVRVPSIDVAIDRFELVAIDASQWAILNLCPYFPRRSRKAPEGFSLASWRDANAAQRLMLKVDALGSRHLIGDFPLGLPAHISTNDALNRIVPHLTVTTSLKIQEFISGSAGKWTRPYVLTPETAGIRPPSFASPPKNDPTFIEPRQPDISKSEPTRLFTLGEFTIALVENPPVRARGGSYKEPIIAAIVASAKDKGALIYTSQKCYRNRPPTICVWQLDGRYRIHNEEFSEKWGDIGVFTNFALRAMRSELGLDDQPVSEHAKVPEGVETSHQTAAATTTGTKPRSVPSPENLEAFVKWLLRCSPDFEELREPYSEQLETFVEFNWKSVRDDIEQNNLTSAQALVARANIIGKSFERNFKPHVEANGGLLGLPAPFQAGAVMLLVKFSVFLYLAKHKYGMPVPEEQLGMTIMSFK